MNAGNQPLAAMQTDCDSAVLQVFEALKSEGFLVQKSFDLRSAITMHGNSACQLVVLLVYPFEGPPVTLILDSDGVKTVVYLASDSHQPAQPSWAGKLVQLLAAAPPMAAPMADQRDSSWLPF